MEIEVRTFDALGAKALYEILSLRAAVFVVEQECAYQDPDGKDERALHVLGRDHGKLVAYTRILHPGDYFEEASIGRVVVHPEARGLGYGRQIMLASMEAVEQELQTSHIVISAQLYLKKFYSELGFTETGSSYLEDGIPHIQMVRK